MIQRVIGKANDFELMLERNGDEWKTLIPANLSGEYVIELWAEDTAGNKSYLASAIFIIDASTLCAHIILQEYTAELIDTEFTAEIIKEDFTAEVIWPVCREKEGIKLV